MNKDETSDATAPAGNGFLISDQPVLATLLAVMPRGGQTLARARSKDLFYVIARDPRSLFFYWELNWIRLFARAGLSPRQVHLRVYRGDGSIESTQEINPFRGHCYAAVAAAGAEYYCELGGFDGSEWTALIRSSATATPEANMSDELSAEFATLPAHLSFQKMLDAFGSTESANAILACSVAELQENARILQTGVATDVSVTEIAAKLNGPHSAGLSALVEIALRSEAPVTPTPEEQARWKELGERYGGSSWTGASHRGFGGGSPA